MSEQPILDIKVLIGSNDHDLVRELELLLAEAMPVTVMGVAQDGRTCIDRAVANRPDILLIDETIGVVPALDVARQVTLAVPGTAAIMIASHADTRMFQQAIVAGARDVLSRPIMLDNLRSSILRTHELEQARTRQLVHFQTDSAITSRSNVVAVYSPRGGAGTTTIAANLAVTLAREVPQSRTVLVDFNTQFGTAAAVMGLKPERTILDLAPFMDDLGTSSAIISNALTPHSSGLRLLAAPPLHLGNVMSGDAAASILLALRRAFTFVVVDLPHMIDDVTLSAIERADHLLHVITPDVLSVQATRMAFDIFQQRGVASDVISLIINRTNKRLEIQPRDIKALFPQPVRAEIPADFYNIEGPMSLGQTLAEAERSSPAYQAIRQLATTIINARPRVQVEQDARPVSMQPLSAARI